MPAAKPQRYSYPKAKPTPGKMCVDCVVEAQGAPIPASKARPAPFPGPRCATHHREVLRSRRISRKVKHVETTYNLSAEQYDALYRFQGGRCALCRRATGASKRLAVDHDHACCIGPKSCGKCVRGLVCSTCNDVLAHFRDSPAAFFRGAAYLDQWPSRRLAAGEHLWWSDGV